MAQRQVHVEIKGDASHLVAALDEATATVRKLRDETDERHHYLGGRTWAAFWADLQARRRRGHP